LGNFPNNSDAIEHDDKRERVKTFLSDLERPSDNQVDMGELAYGLSLSDKSEEDNLLPLLTETMRSQILHASKTGKYNHRHARLVFGRDGYSVLEHTDTEEAAISNVNLSNFGSKTTNDRVPRTMEDALMSSDQARVITEMKPPFRITNVNQAWMDMCGFDDESECVGHTLGLIQGPETDRAAVTAIVNRLMQSEEECGAVLTNYKKDGSKFRNRLRVGALTNEYGDVTHFIGVLQILASTNDIVENGAAYDKPSSSVSMAGF